MLDVCPSRDDGTQDHESEGEKSHGCDRAAEPKNLAVCDQDDRQILEDGVDGNRQIFESFCTGIDHSDEEDGYREPWPTTSEPSTFLLLKRTFLCLICLEISICDYACGFACLYSDNAYY